MVGVSLLARILAVLAIGVIALLTACLAGSARLQGPSNTPSEPDMKGAKDAYPLAERLARSWKADAELRTVRATWTAPTPAQLREGKAAWAFYFVSPSSVTGDKVAGYIVSLRDGKAEGLTERQFAAGKPFIFVDWKVDSAQALRVFLENGGQDFLAVHAVAEVLAILQTGEGAEPPVWQVTALDRTTKETLSLQIDASKGVVRRLPK